MLFITQQKRTAPPGVDAAETVRFSWKVVEPKTLQKILGHNSLQMTMDLYCHVRESTLTDEMERIANFM